MASCSAHMELVALVNEIEELLNEIAKDRDERNALIFELLG